VITVDQSKIKEIKNEQARANRAAAYRVEADPIFFQAQRGDATVEEWQAKIDEIKQRFPYAD